jgi:hypothetical protein
MSSAAIMTGPAGKRIALPVRVEPKVFLIPQIKLEYVLQSGI